MELHKKTILRENRSRFSSRGSSAEQVRIAKSANQL